MTISKLVGVSMASNYYCHCCIMWRSLEEDAKGYYPSKEKKNSEGNYGLFEQSCGSSMIEKKLITTRRSFTRRQAPNTWNELVVKPTDELIAN